MDRPERRLEMAVEMLTWFVAAPDLLKRIGKALDLPALSDLEKQNLRETATRISKSFGEAAEMADADQSNERFYKQIVVSTNEFREEIVRANLILDRLKVPDSD